MLPPPDGGTFRVLFVCTGNICRSPFAATLFARRLSAAGVPAAAVVIRSAGTRATPGLPMTPETAHQLSLRDCRAGEHRARTLVAEQIEASDLVLTATRAQRAEAVSLVPAASRRVFTIREFGRLSAAVDAAEVARRGGAGGERLRAIVEEAVAFRGMLARGAAGEADVEDPFGGPDEAYARMSANVESALARPIEMFAWAMAPEAPVPSPPASLPAAEHRLRVRSGARRRRRWRRRARRGLIATGVIFLVLAGAAALLGWRASQAYGELVAARPIVADARAAAETGDTDAVRRRLSGLQAHAAAADRATKGWLWSAASRLPIVGDELRAVRSITADIHEVSARVLPPLIQVAPSLRPDALRPAGDRIELAALARAAPALTTAAARAEAIDARTRAVESAGLIGPVQRAVAAAGSATGDLAHLTRSAATVARILPPLFGADGAKRYLLAIQSPAEARGTGGLLGSWALLEADRGRIRMIRLGSRTELKDGTDLPLQLGHDFTDLYGDDPGLWVNANMSPYFPEAAQLWLAMWQRQFGAPLDGVIATDPVALGYLLAATGPARLPDGTTITAANAAALAMRDVYERFPLGSQDRARDRYIRGLAEGVFRTLLRGAGRAGNLVDSLKRAAAEHRLNVYAADPELQAQLADTPVAGLLPTSSGSPSIAVVVNQGFANKIDYYLRRTVEYRLGPCNGPSRGSTVTIGLRNNAPRVGLPPYVAGLMKGRSRLLVYVHATAGASLVRARVDGTPLYVTPGREHGRPVFAFPIELDPGAGRTVTLDLLEPSLTGPAQVWDQPLANPASVAVSQAACAAR